MSIGSFQASCLILNTSRMPPSCAGQAVIRGRRQAGRLETDGEEAH